MALSAYAIPELFPQPKRIERLEGDSDLSNDVRLVTSNVSPLQRKAIRSILSDIGIRVVANKKKYVIDAKVEDPSAFDLSQVPENCREDYYELTLDGSEVHVRAPGQNGTVWATQTAANLFRLFLKGVTFPNLIIKDWPAIPVRGIFVENKWGPDRMTLSDWTKMIDELSSLKMNTIGIGLYGCWGSCRFEEDKQPTEFLMVPVPGHEDIKTYKNLRWYSPEKKNWISEKYLPTLREKPELLEEIIAYAAERSITIVPFFNSFGHNSLFPREIPEISAKDENGNPTAIGYCITSPKTRDFIAKLYGSIIDRYYPNGCEYFHIQTDEVWPDYPWPNDPKKVGDPWCKCPECQKKKAEENLLDYVFWLVDMLVKKGVKKVVMWNDQLTRHMNAFNADFVKRLEDAGLKDKLILHWWGYNNQGIHESNHLSIGKKLGIDGWVAPMTCYFNWSNYDYRRPNIEIMLRMCEEEGGIGAMSYAVHDESHLDHEAALAAYAWESTKGNVDCQEMQKRWASYRFGENAAKYLEAAEKIYQAVATPGYGTCLNYSYTYVRADKDWPRPYPDEPLTALEAMPEALDNLAKAAELAHEAAALLDDLKAAQGLAAMDNACLDSLRAEAARIIAMAEAFQWMLQLRKELANGMVMKRMSTAAIAARDAFREQMAIVEQGKPGWVAPATLMAISRTYEFIDQLAGELKAHAARKQAKLLHWYIVKE